VTASKEKWWKGMIAKHGSKEAVSKFMADSARQVKERRGSGFASIAKRDPERVKEISRLGVEAKAKKRKEADEVAKLDKEL
jgi:hypothetical protein